MPAPVWIDETTSTQDAVRTWAQARRPEGVSLVAEVQTEGRGRLGRVWTSPTGTAVQLSVLLRPDVPPERLPLVSLAAAVAVRQAVRGRLGIKWPNDLLGTDERKVAGILAEADVAAGRVRSVVVGIGINVRAAPVDVPHAGCLDEYGPPMHREELAVDVVAQLLAWTRRLEQSPDLVVSAWSRGCLHFGRPVTVGDVAGIAEDVAEDGALLLRTHDGSLRRIVAGDVQMVRVDGEAS